MSIEKLKATAYDIMAQLQFLQQRLEETNKAIGEEMKKQTNAKVATLEEVKEAQALSWQVVEETVKPESV